MPVRIIFLPTFIIDKLLFKSSKNKLKKRIPTILYKYVNPRCTKDSYIIACDKISTLNIYPDSSTYIYIRA